MIKLFDGQYTGLRVLVTGHTGFKGSWLSVWLRELGAEVLGYSLEPPTNPSNFELCDLSSKMQHVIGDIRDLEKLTATVEIFKPEIIFHLAAQPIVLTSYREPKETFDTNVTGTVNVLEAIRKTDSVKVFIGITTDKVYADQGWYWGYRENDQLGGYDPYSASKSMAELAIASYRSSWEQKWSSNATTKQFSNNSVAIASARAGNVIGGGDFADFRILPDFMRACVSGEEMVMRNPDSIRPWQHLLEPISGYLLLAQNMLNNKESFSEAWNFGPSEREAITCESVIKKASSEWENSSYKLADNSMDAHETHILRVNWDKASHRLKWSPVYSWKEAVEETVEWWKAYAQVLKGSADINMYNICVNHINDYVSSASKKNLKWTSKKD